MGESTRKWQDERRRKSTALVGAPVAAVRVCSLGELIHAQVRRAIELAVEEELEAALGVPRYERDRGRRGYRNGQRKRTLSGPTGPVELTLPRGRLFQSTRGAAGATTEWQSRLVPWYERRMEEVNEAVVAACLAGGNTRQIRGALRPLLKDAPLSRSVVSRVVGSIKSDFEALSQESLEDLNVPYLYLDAIALRIRSGRKVTNLPVLVAVKVLADGAKRQLRAVRRPAVGVRRWRPRADGDPRTTPCRHGIGWRDATSVARGMARVERPDTGRAVSRSLPGAHCARAAGIRAPFPIESRCTAVRHPARP